MDEDADEDADDEDEDADVDADEEDEVSSCAGRENTQSKTACWKMQTYNQIVFKKGNF